MTGYRITPIADRDLREIPQYVAEQDGVDRALHVHGKFPGAFELRHRIFGTFFTRPPGERYMSLSFPRITL
jgi:plasmid stabilization system protein ParE